MDIQGAEDNSNRQVEERADFYQTHTAPSTTDEFDFNRLTSDRAEFYANMDVPAMVEDIMEWNGGPPGQLYTPSPQDWITPAPRSQHLPGESGYIGPSASGTGNVDWGASCSSTPASTVMGVAQGVSDPVLPLPVPLGPASSIWLMSRDPALAKQSYDKNLSNLNCAGIDTPALLLQRCIDIWLAIASGKK
jgi:hypothetical protein